VRHGEPILPTPADTDRLAAALRRALDDEPDDDVAEWVRRLLDGDGDGERESDRASSLVPEVPG
jgi:hypothetical protein